MAKQVCELNVKMTAQFETRRWDSVAEGEADDRILEAVQSIQRAYGCRRTDAVARLFQKVADLNMRASLEANRKLDELLGEKMVHDPYDIPEVPPMWDEPPGPVPPAQAAAGRGT